MVTLLNPKMPTHVKNWLILFHNNFHNGAATSFLQKLEYALQIHLNWRAYMTTQTTLTCRTPGYATALLTWVNKQYEGRFQFGSGDAIEALVTLKTRLDELGIFDKWKRLLGAKAGFNNPLLVGDVALKNFNSLLSRMYVDYWGTIPQWLFLKMFLVLSTFLVLLSLIILSNWVLSHNRLNTPNSS